MEHRVTGSVIGTGVERWDIVPFTTRTFEEAVTNTWERMFNDTLVRGTMPQIYEKVMVYIKEVRPGGPEHHLVLHPKILPQLTVTIEGGVFKDLTFGHGLTSYENCVKKYIPLLGA